MKDNICIIHSNYKYNERVYKRIYYVRVLNRLLKNYSVYESLKIISKRFRSKQFKMFIRSNFKYISIYENFIEISKIIDIILENHMYIPKNIYFHKCKNTHSNIKRIQTCKKLYNVENVSQLNNVKEKVKETMISKYNGYTLQSDILIEKMKKTNLERYNSEYFQSTKLHKEKVKKTCREKYNIDNVSQMNFDCDLVKDVSIWYENAENNRIDMYKMLDLLNISKSTYRKYKPQDLITIKQYNFKESQFLSEIESHYNISLIKQYKIDNYYVDGICLENFQNISNSTVPVIFEFLGDYWHGYKNNNEINRVNKKSFRELYNKTFKRFSKLKSQGYRIFYIWESEYNLNGISSLKEYIERN